MVVLKTLIIPDGTRMDDRNIVVGEDVLIGNYAEIGYGIISKSIIAGEGVSIHGDVVADGDIKFDLWSVIDGNIRTKSDAELGEGVKVHGKLIVYGDLSIGKDILIEDGFEARGCIMIRNPIPMIVYILLYLAGLLRLGKGEELEKFLSMLEEEEEINDEIIDQCTEGRQSILVIPNRAKIMQGVIRIPGEAIIGGNCRLVGNLSSKSLRIRENTTLFGSVRTREDVYIGENGIVHGDLISGGVVHVDKGGNVLGEIRAENIRIHEDASVEGAMRTKNEVLIIRE
jgi:predicted acyltransferase (DUF342 family)